MLRRDTGKKVEVTFFARVEGEEAAQLSFCVCIVPHTREGEEREEVAEIHNITPVPEFMFRLFCPNRQQEA